MPKPFLGCLLQTHEGYLPSLVSRHGCTGLCCHPSRGWGGCQGMSGLWTLSLPFFNFPSAGRGQSSFPKDMEGWTVSTSPARLGLLPVWGQGVLSGLGRPWEPVPVPPQGTLIMGGPRLPCAAAIAQRAWDTCPRAAGLGMPGGLPGDLIPGQGRPSLQHPLPCVAGGQCHG